MQVTILRHETKNVCSDGLSIILGRGMVLTFFVFSSASNQTNCRVYTAHRNMDAVSVTLKKASVLKIAFF